MKPCGPYRNTLLVVNDSKTIGKTKKSSKPATKAQARFYLGEDLNIRFSDPEQLLPLYNAVVEAMNMATDPKTADEFRDLTLRIVGKQPERLTLTVGGYVSTGKLDGQAA